MFRTDFYSIALGGSKWSTFEKLRCHRWVHWTVQVATIWAKRWFDTSEHPHKKRVKVGPFCYKTIQFWRSLLFSFAQSHCWWILAYICLYIYMLIMLTYACMSWYIYSYIYTQYIVVGWNWICLQISPKWMVSAKKLPKSMVPPRGLESDPCPCLHVSWAFNYSAPKADPPIIAG